jgi:tetratricopeptide (TPR) repeat protein
VDDLDRALAAQDDPRARRLRAEARKDLQDYDGAREDLESALGRDPHDGWSLAELAELHCDAGRFELAGPLLLRLEERHGREGWYWALRGRALAASGRVVEALSALDKAAALSPESAPIAAWRGEALRRLGRPTEAEAAFDLSVRLDPRFAYAYEWRGRLLLALERPGEALSDLERVVRLDPRHYSGPVMRGEALFKLGRYPAAAADFDRVYPLDPRTTWTPRSGEGRPPASRESEYWADLDAAVAARPGDAWPLVLRGRARALAGRPSEALEDLRAGLRIRPLSRARAWAGLALLKWGKPEEALGVLDCSRGRWAAAWRGRALALLGRPREALPEYDRALARDESLLAEVREWKAQALEALGRGGEAARERERAGRWRGLARGVDGRRAPRLEAKA